MKEHLRELQPFDKKRLKEIRKLRKGNKHCFSEGANSSFWDELECILKCNPKSYVWEQMKKDDIVIGEVWSQPIGEFYYKHTVHKFEYLYVKSEGLVIDYHKHEESIHGGKQIMKIREFYIFPDGKIETCGKDCKHRLVNNYGKPIYVISLKISGNVTNQSSELRNIVI